MKTSLSIQAPSRIHKIILLEEPSLLIAISRIMTHNDLRNMIDSGWRSRDMLIATHDNGIMDTASR
jgi:hypothetical protein